MRDTKRLLEQIAYTAPWGALCRRVRICGLAARPCAGQNRTNAVSAHRGGVKKTRMKNFDLVILLGHSKTNFDPQDGGAV